MGARRLRTCANCACHCANCASTARHGDVRYVVYMDIHNNILILFIILGVLQNLSQDRQIANRVTQQRILTPLVLRSSIWMSAGGADHLP